MRNLGPILAGALIFATPAWPSQAHVVELFTSQGCSSCPPADALLGELAARPDVIALAFHVDYWDSLGWRDRFSMADATRRQSRYVDALNLPSAFTPQMVVDGHLSFVGSDRARVGAALQQPPSNVAPIPIGLRIADGQLYVSLPDGKDHCDCDIVLAAYLQKTSTAIGRGENSGRTLVEYNVVRQLRRVAAWAANSGEFKISLESIPADATDAAILLQSKGQSIAGAATIALH